jgi:hypothetical protein
MDISCGALKSHSLVRAGLAELFRGLGDLLVGRVDVDAKARPEPRIDHPDAQVARLRISSVRG